MESNEDLPPELVALRARPSFVLGPLCIITGAPGVGKSEVARGLIGRTDRAVVLDVDLWGQKEYRSDPELMTRWLREWLRFGVAVAQSNQLLILPGFVRPRELEPLPERELLSEIVYIALYCRDEELAKRLGGRPKSEAIPGSELEGLKRVNEELRQIGESDARVELVDTTEMSPDRVVDAVQEIISRRVSRIGS